MNTELVALEALRKIQSAIVVGHVSLVKARLSPGPALFLLNNKKAELAGLEKTYNTHIYILADGRLRNDEYEFEMESPRDRPADGHEGQTLPPQKVTVTSPPPRTVSVDDEEDEDQDEFESDELETSETEAPHPAIASRPAGHALRSRAGRTTQKVALSAKDDDEVEEVEDEESDDDLDQEAEGSGK
jgi:ribonuclease E